MVMDTGVQLTLGPEMETWREAAERLEAEYRQRLAAGETFSTERPPPVGNHYAVWRLERQGVLEWGYFEDGDGYKQVLWPAGRGGGLVDGDGKQAAEKQARRAAQGNQAAAQAVKDSQRDSRSRAAQQPSQRSSSGSLGAC